MSEKSNNNYSVYYHYNKLNGKYYVGITMQEPHKRWNRGNGYRGNPHFWHAIQRDGWDNFEHVVVESGLSKEMAASLEKRLIIECNSYNNGYNNSHGGESIVGYNMAQAIKDKISKANSGENGYWYGKKLPTDMIRKMAEKHINHPALSKPINQYDLEGHYIKTFPSAQEALRELGSSNYARAIREGNNGSAMGYQWRYDNGDRSDIEPYNSFRPRPERRKAVLQYDLQGNFIREYDNVADICDGKNPSHIFDCCNKVRNSAMGYIWRYKDITNAQCNTDGYYDICPYRRGTNSEKEIVVYKKNGDFVGKYDSLNEASRLLHLSPNLISAVCLGERKHTQGYVFAYTDITDSELQKKIDFANAKIVRKPVKQYDLLGNYIATYKGVRNAVAAIGVTGRDKIVACCHEMIPEAYGYIWKYANEVAE